MKHVIMLLGIPALHYVKLHSCVLTGQVSQGDRSCCQTITTLRPRHIGWYHAGHIFESLYFIIISWMFVPVDPINNINEHWSRKWLAAYLAPNHLNSALMSQFAKNWCVNIAIMVSCHSYCCMVQCYALYVTSAPNKNMSIVAYLLIFICDSVL